MKIDCNFDENLVIYYKYVKYILKDRKTLFIRWELEQVNGNEKIKSIKYINLKIY